MIIPTSKPDKGSKVWIEEQIVIVIQTAMWGKPASPSPVNPQPRLERNPALALSALIQLAKLKGYVVERHQSIAGKLDLGKLSPGDAKMALDSMLDTLSPGERQQILQLTSNRELVAIAEAQANSDE